MRPFLLGAFAALCLAPALAGQTRAAENDDLFKYGSLSCDEWIRHSELTAAETPKWFGDLLAQLYQSGGYRIDILSQIKPDQTTAWLTDYCRAHPLDGLAVAGAVLTNELAARAAIKKE
jgi:hypothetical protein